MLESVHSYVLLANFHRWKAVTDWLVCKKPKKQDKTKLCSPRQVVSDQFGLKPGLVTLLFPWLHNNKSSWQCGNFLHSPCDIVSLVSLSCFWLNFFGKIIS